MIAAVGAFFSALEANLVAQRIVYRDPHPAIFPQGEVAVAAVPGEQVVWHHPPRAAASHHVQYAVEDLALGIDGWAAQPAGARD